MSAPVSVRGRPRRRTRPAPPTSLGSCRGAACPGSERAGPTVAGDAAPRPHLPDIAPRCRLCGRWTRAEIAKSHEASVRAATDHSGRVNAFGGVVASAWFDRVPDGLLRPPGRGWRPRTGSARHRRSDEAHPHAMACAGGVKERKEREEKQETQRTQGVSKNARNAKERKACKRKSPDGRAIRALPDVVRSQRTQTILPDQFFSATL